jgi:hypothetical protein
MGIHTRKIKMVESGSKLDDWKIACKFRRWIN